MMSDNENDFLGGDSSDFSVDLTQIIGLESDIIDSNEIIDSAIMDTILLVDEKPKPKPETRKKKNRKLTQRPTKIINEEFYKLGARSLGYGLTPLPDNLAESEKRKFLNRKSKLKRKICTEGLFLAYEKKVKEVEEMEELVDIQHMQILKLLKQINSKK